jgi:UDP-2,4-diacetamido-2,4,6-trideoxy-beta-L-altropyranose hydrolase
MPASPSIYIRTDGNTEIATGHLMRCLAIGRACVKQGATVTFIVSDEESLALLQGRFVEQDEFNVHCLHSDYRKMTEELPGLIAYLELHAPIETVHATKSPVAPWLFIDSYFATPAYFAALRPHCQVAYLDDLKDFPCDVDLVINYDTDEDCPFYAAAKRKLLGVAYTPLREQFSKPPYEVRPIVRSILLSTGGTDPYDVAEQLLARIFDAEIPAGTANTAAHRRTLLSCDYHILTSTANSHYHRLLALAKANPKIHIHKNVSDMAALMAACDLAVSAGGTTLCELCAVGVPTISYLMAENQRTAAETFASKGLIPFAGDIRGAQASALPAEHMPDTLPDINMSAIENILKFLTRMSVDVSTREKSSHAMRAFLDGQGTERIAAALLRQ